MRKPKAPEANRARIVEAAIDEFAARGFKGASMDAIAARTHTTRALINYYFGSKEKIYLAVLEHVYAEIRQAEGLLDLDHLVAGRRHPPHRRVHLQLLPGARGLRAAGGRREPGPGPPPAEIEGDAHRSTARSSTGWPRVIARGQAEGTFRADVDPSRSTWSIAALGMFNVTNQYTFGAIFQRDMGAKGDVRRRRELVTDVILGYLTTKS